MIPKQVNNPYFDVAFKGAQNAAAALGGAGPADQPTLRAQVPRTDALVVAVEQEPVGVLEPGESRLGQRQDERLEEPGDVGAVPLRR